MVFADGRRARAVTLGNDHGVDAGMVKIVDKGPWPSAEMGSSGNLQAGQWCLTLGYPVSFEHGKPPAVRIGRVLDNRRRRSSPTAPSWAAIRGPAVGPGREGHRHRHQVRQLLAGLQHPRADRPIPRRVAGFGPRARISTAWPGRRCWGSSPRGRADARIGHVVPGSGAEQAGSRPGDVIVKFAGQEIRKLRGHPALGPGTEARRPRGGRVPPRRAKPSRLAVTFGEDDSRKEEE